MVSLTQLHAVSPLDGRYQQRLTVLQQLLSEFALIKYRVIVEVRYLIFLLEQTKLKEFSDSQKQTLLALISEFSDDDALRIKELEVQCKHDVKAVEYFLQEKFREKKLAEYIPYIHFGLTSEDVNSCAYGLALSAVRNQVMVPALVKVIEKLVAQAENSADSVMLARTHGQPAVPTTLGKELIVFAVRLKKELGLFQNIQVEAKLSGAVGNWNAVQFVLPEVNWTKLSAQFITSLGLMPNLVTTQIVPTESYSQFFQSLVRINGIVIDCSRDCWQYISDGYFVQQAKKEHVGSSTMPHKVNPIDFENSEGNAGLAIALLQHFIEKLPISRLQRDLSDSTVKRSFGTALGHSYLASTSLLRGLEVVSPDKDRLKAVVQAHPEVLAEALQTALRLSGVADAYDTVKHQTRGKESSVDTLRTAADGITEPKLRQQFQQLQSEHYTGLASEVVKIEATAIKTLLKKLQQIHRKDDDA